ncbi:hypothetical protein Droror1_Dr00017359, partial [Drosera rotundifolia]
LQEEETILSRAILLSKSCTRKTYVMLLSHQQISRGKSKSSQFLWLAKLLVHWREPVYLRWSCF